MLNKFTLNRIYALGIFNQDYKSPDRSSELLQKQAHVALHCHTYV